MAHPEKQEYLTLVRIDWDEACWFHFRTLISPKEVQAVKEYVQKNTYAAFGFFVEGVRRASFCVNIEPQINGDSHFVILMAAGRYIYYLKELKSYFREIAKAYKCSHIRLHFGQEAYARYIRRKLKTQHYETSEIWEIE